jgi:hypothetical protein
MTSYPEVSRNRRRYGVNHIEKYALGITPQKTITYKVKGGNSVVIDLITNAQDSITDGDLNNARQVLKIYLLAFAINIVCGLERIVC